MRSAPKIGFTLNCPASSGLRCLDTLYSRMKYGRKKIFVDQEIEDRIGIAKS